MLHKTKLLGFSATLLTLLSRLCNALKKPGEALKEFEVALITSPNRFGSLSGAAQAAKSLGDVQKTRSFYSKLVAICNQADSDRAELQEANSFLRQK